MRLKQTIGLAATFLMIACSDPPPPGLPPPTGDVKNDAVDDATPDSPSTDGPVGDSQADAAKPVDAAGDASADDVITADVSTDDVITADVSTDDVITTDVSTDDVITTDGPTCMAPFSMCGTSCVELSNDTANCGRCGNACSAGQVCMAGSCTTTCIPGQTLCTTGGGPVCTDTMVDGTNCGRCGNLCVMGQTCTAGACVMGCAMGTTSCPGAAGARVCADLTSDRANCGSCGTACATGLVCTMGACACAGAATLCGTACIDTNTDASNCGRCGTVCAMGQRCVAGACGCPMGQTACGTRCVATATDTANCGACGNACAMGSTCTAGTCVAGGPSNDGRAGATRIDLSSPSVSLSTDTTAARNDTSGTCGCTSGNDVFYSFTLTASEIVYADTIGATWDTSLFFQNSMGVNLTDAALAGGSACNDDNGLGCTSGLQSMIAARLAPGTYFLVLSGCGSGAATVRVHHLPVGNGPVAQLTPRGTVALMGTTAGTGVITSTCCSGGPENTYYWVTCPDFTATPFAATTCGGATAFDSEIDQRSANRAATSSTCNDDSCGLLSLVTSTIPSGAGLHTLYLDGCGSGAGAYNLSVTFGACPAGTLLCSGRCATTATDTNNCGRCGNVCPTGQVCSAGACTMVCAAPTRLCGTSCADTSTDNNNCGACGTVCPTGQRCAAGACGCAGTTSLCGTSCVDTNTDSANCGRCGNACAAALLCVGGSCRCPGTTSLCGAACVDTTSDRTNCGRCSNACGAGQACTGSACVCTGAGLTACGTTCANTTNDVANCGRCGNACPAGQVCTASACVAVGPANDLRAGATVISLGAASSRLAADTTSAVNNTAGSCGCTTGNDVFYTFTLTAPEIVYADTIGATWDTSLFLQTAAGVNITDPVVVGGLACNDDNGLAGCSTGAQSQIFARLGAGTYFLVLSGCGRGAATINFQHLPVGNGPARSISPTAGSQTVTGTTTGTGLISGACCSGGPEDTFYWFTCGATLATSFTASACGGATFDTDLDQRSAGRTSGVIACNDDSCGLQSLVTSTIPAGAGIHTLYVDGCGAGAGAYSVNVIFGSCPTGTTNCSTRCVNTATDSSNCGACARVCPTGQACSASACACTGAGLTTCGATCVNAQTDAANCGGCGRACAAGRACVAGVCAVPGPANDLRTGAITISTSSPSTSVTANTTTAVNNTSGTCGCTTGNDVFYTFTLTAPEIVYANTIGATWDTSLFFQTAGGVNIADAALPGGATCNDDNGMGCSTGLQSVIAARLAAGTYFLVLSGCGNGTATINFQHLPVGNGPVATLAAGAGRTVAGSTSGSGIISGSCCDGGPENTFYWVSCPGYAGGAFSAATCSAATWDTDLAQRSATRAVPIVCNDDSCGLQSRMTSTIPAGPGLHTMYIDGCGTGQGAYTVTYTRP